MFLFFCVLLRFAAAPAQGQARLPQPLQELVRTEVVYPQEQHETQLTFVSDVYRHRDSRSFSFPVHIEYGLTDAWQIEGEWTTFAEDQLEGVALKGTGEIGFGTKYSFMRIHGSNLHLALGVDVDRSVDRSRDRAATHEWETTPFLSAALDLPPRWQIFGEVGGTIAQNAFANAGALVAFHRATLATEINWIDSGPRHEVYVTPSLTIHVSRCCDLGIGASAGLTGGADRYSVVVQFIAEK